MEQIEDIIEQIEDIIEKYIDLKPSVKNEISTYISGNVPYGIRSNPEVTHPW